MRNEDEHHATKMTERQKYRISPLSKAEKCTLFANQGLIKDNWDVQ